MFSQGNKSMELTVINTHASNLSRVSITHTSSRNGRNLGHIIQLPQPGKMLIKEIGCLEIKETQALRIEGADADSALQSLQFYIEDDCGKWHSSLISDNIQHQYLGIEYVCWRVGIRNNKNVIFQSFLHLEDALRLFFEHPSSVCLCRPPVCRTGWNEPIFYLAPNPGIYTKICMNNEVVIKVDGNLFVADYAPVLKQDLDTIEHTARKYHHNLNIPSVSVPPIEVELIKDAMNYYFLEFLKLCKPRKFSVQGHYAARMMPNTNFISLSKQWFQIQWMENLPLFYQERVLSDGSLLFYFPHECDQWSDESRWNMTYQFRMKNPGFILMDIIHIKRIPLLKKLFHNPWKVI